MKNFLFAFLACGFILASCGGDDCSLVEMTEDAEEYLALGTEYAADSTKCDDYKIALEDFIEKYNDCDDESISSQVSTTQAVLDALPCN